MSVPVDADSIERLRLAMARTTRRIDRHVAGDGLTRTQLSVLAAVELRGPIGLGELSEYEGINPTMLSRVVAKLEELGLIRREVDPVDRRAARVAITEAGSLLRRQLNARRLQLITERLAGLPEGCVAQLIAALPAMETLAEQMALPSTASGAGQPQENAATL